MSKAIGVLHIHGRDESELRIPPAALTYAGFRSWMRSEEFPEKGLRATYVEGEVLLDMSPEELEGHNKVKGEVFWVLYGIVKKEALGEIYSDGALLSHPDAGLSCEPDLLFVAWPSFQAGRVKLVEKARHDDRYVELEGTPDLVLEVVSDSSLRKDLKLLRDAYFRAGVPEYWVIDARGEAVRFEILHRSDIGYHAAAAPDAPQRSQVLARTFTLTRTRNLAGRFEYDLTVVA